MDARRTLTVSPFSALGFRELRVVDPGSKTIAKQGNLDLYGRADESVRVEPSR